MRIHARQLHLKSGAAFLLKIQIDALVCLANHFGWLAVDKTEK
jgi:hypothetical protein